jgi:hypothetical protein
VVRVRVPARGVLVLGCAVEQSYADIGKISAQDFPKPTQGRSEAQPSFKELWWFVIAIIALAEKLATVRTYTFISSMFNSSLFNFALLLRPSARDQGRK